MSFGYLLDKIRSAQFETEPFRHLFIPQVFDERHFEQIVAAQEISLGTAATDEELFEELFDRGYKIINFPGCITDRDVYIKWHKRKTPGMDYTSSACEGFGVTVRLLAPRSAIIAELVEFMGTSEFQMALAEKFGLSLGALYYDTGIQKYLDGYEISPHPDTRNKALTYMVNINPAADSEKREHHTHYLRFRPEYSYVRAYWEGRPGEDRCWVPWPWCETVKVQSQNNSMVVFSPANDTMHGVKAAYKHLDAQRTQMYGNLWYREVQATPGPEWEDFVVRLPQPKMSLRDRVKSAMPAWIKNTLKAQKPADKHVIEDRLK